MAAAGEDFEIEDAPSCFKSDVWQHFGFPKSENEKGGKIKDKTTCKFLSCLCEEIFFICVIYLIFDMVLKILFFLRQKKQSKEKEKCFVLHSLYHTSEIKGDFLI